MGPALKAFHRKHFQDFGMVIGRGTGKAARPMQLGFVKPHERLGYATAHFTSLTTEGWSNMPTETKALSQAAKIAMRLQMEKAQNEVNATIAAILNDANLNPEDGWKVTPDGDATREVAEQPTGPVLGVDAPADSPSAFNAAPSVPLDPPADAPATEQASA